MVPEEISAGKSDAIRKMFGRISSRYDLANTVLSVGIHHLWRNKLVQWSGVSRGAEVLDCATGTGDLAFEWERALGPEATVIATDFCDEMLFKALEKGQTVGTRVRFEVADVMNLPFRDACFDAASISFGIRNVADPRRGLSELGRVVRPGGVVMVLEFGQPQSAVFGKLYRLYSERVLPKVGGWISGQPEAYTYLQRSSSLFACRDEFLEMARATGFFASSQYRPLTAGIAYLYKLMRSDGRSA